MKSRGIVLITILLIISATLLLGAFLTKILISDYGIIHLSMAKAKTFYIAEAGIEKGKCEVVANPNFYTDISHSGDEVLWLLKEAKGLSISLGDGEFKFVKEKDKNVIYSVGYFNDIGKSKALSLLKIEYTYPPFKQILWKELK